MISTITMVPHINNPNSLETVLRIKIKAELAEIQEEIKRFGTADELSQVINSWYHNFSAALRLHCNDQETLSTYIQLMQELLMDPITHIPLDKHPRLGSDGKTYSCLFLFVYLNDPSNRYKDRSPLDPLNLAPFTTSPHHLASYLAGWLQRHGALLYTDEMEQAYLQLVQTNSPKEPTHSAQGLRERIRQRQAMRDVENNRQIATFQQTMKSVEQQFREWAEQDLKEIKERAEIIREKSIEMNQEIRRIDQKQLTALNQRLEMLSKEIAETESNIKDLKQNIQGVKREIDQVRQDTIQLQILTNEVKLALKKRKGSVLESFGKAVLIIGGCAFSNWALQGIVDGGVIPIPNGFALKFSIAL